VQLADPLLVPEDGRFSGKKSEIGMRHWEHPGSVMCTARLESSYPGEHKCCSWVVSGGREAVQAPGAVKGKQWLL